MASQNLRFPYLRGPHRKQHRMDIEREVQHFATGGIAHFLTLLEGSVDYAAEKGSSLHVFTQHHRPLGLKSFSDLFANQVDVDSLNLMQTGVGSDYSVSRAPSASNPVDYYLTLGSETLPLPHLHLSAIDSSLDGVIRTVGRPRGPKTRFHGIVNWLALSPTILHDVACVIPEAKLSEGPYIALHFRNTDRKTKLSSALAELESSPAFHAVDTIFLSSDDPNAADALQPHLKAKRLLHIPRLFQSAGPNLHYGVQAEDSYEQLVHALADLKCLVDSDFFIPSVGSGTGWTPLVQTLRKDPLRGFFNPLLLAP
jgi:hypothetical protein